MAKTEIRLTENELKNFIREAISEIGGGIHPNGQIDMFQNQDEVDMEHSEANDDVFFQFMDTIEKCGWSITDSRDQNGGGVYVIEPNNRNACPEEKLKQGILSNVKNSSYIKFGTRTYNNAPEIKKMIVFIPNHENINFVNEGRFGSVYDNHDFQGEQINGKTGLLQMSDGSSINVKNILFYGDRILCDGEDGKNYNLFLSSAFGQPLNGSNIPFAYPNQNGVQIKNLSLNNGSSCTLNVSNGIVNENKTKKETIRLSESKLMKMIQEAIKETALDYDIDNFSGRWNKNIPDNYIDPEGSLDDPNENPKSIEGWNEVYNSGNPKQDEINYSWDEFDSKGIAPSANGVFSTTTKNGINMDKDIAMDRRNRETNWSDRQMKSANKMKDKWVSGERSLDDIDDAWFGASLEEAVHKVLSELDWKTYANAAKKRDNQIQQQGREATDKGGNRLTTLRNNLDNAASKALTSKYAQRSNNGYPTNNAQVNTVNGYQTITSNNFDANGKHSRGEYNYDNKGEINKYGNNIPSDMDDEIEKYMNKNLNEAISKALKKFLK